MNAIRYSILSVAMSLVSASSAAAQCLQWENTFATQGFDGEVRALAVYRPCSGGEPSLYAGGGFTTAGGVSAVNVARWNGSTWSPVGAGLPGGGVYAFLVYDDGSGSGPALYAGGSFAGCNGGVLAKWNGSTWTLACDPHVDYVTSPVEALAAYDSAIYLGGIFDVSFNGGQSFGYSLLRYAGGSFTPVCCLSGSSFFFGVRALTVFDRGSGLELVAAGEFNTPANNIASFNGSTWSAFGGGVGGFMNPVYSVESFDSGSGTELYAGTGSGVSRWTGSAWASLGLTDGNVHSLVAYGDGSGPASLYAGGAFTTIGGVSASRIARWDGTAWSAVGTGITAPASSTRVAAMTSFDDHLSGGSDLYVGGNFSAMGGVTSPNIAEWSGCGNLTGTAFCFGDGSLATPCPCAPPDTVPNPAAAPRHGCANSFNLDGAQLFARGSTSLDNVVLTTSGQSPVAFGFFLVGTAQDTSGVASADGVRCVDGALTRFGSQYAMCGSVKYPNAAAGWTAPLSVVSGTTPGSGLSKYYQVYYRNAAASFCTGATTNWTSGYRLDW